MQLKLEDSLISRLTKVLFCSGEKEIYDSVLEQQKEQKEFQHLIPIARDLYQTNDIEIDDFPNFSEALGDLGKDGGVWVSAWVWVPVEQSEKDDEVCDLGMHTCEEVAGTMDGKTFCEKAQAGRNLMIDITTYLSAIGFSDPDSVGESEYRAVYDTIHDGLAEVPPEERLEMVLAMLEQFEKIAHCEIHLLKKARKEKQNA